MKFLKIHKVNTVQMIDISSQISRKQIFILQKLIDDIPKNWPNDFWGQVSSKKYPKDKLEMLITIPLSISTLKSHYYMYV